MNTMRRILVVPAVVALLASSAAASVITWDVDIADNGDGSSRYLIKAMTDDMAILSFSGAFHCTGQIAQIQGDPDMSAPCEWQQIDKFADAVFADLNPSCPYDKNNDSYLWQHWDFVPAPWTETVNSYGGDAGHVPPPDPDAGKGVFLEMVQLVAPTGLDFQTAIDEGDFGYRGVLYLWDGVSGHEAVETDAPFGIPEPATMSLLVIGGAAVLRRRRRKA